jgi:hypothetical protein
MDDDGNVTIAFTSTVAEQHFAKVAEEQLQGKVGTILLLSNSKLLLFSF